MKSVHILAVIFSLASTLAPCFASLIPPTQVHPYYRVLEKLNTATRQFTCDSKADCNNNDECINVQGPCQTSDCNGVCADLNECSCTDPCPSGSSCATTSAFGFTSGALCIADASIEISESIDIDGVNFSVLSCDESSNVPEEENDSDENGSDENGSEGSNNSDGEEGSSVCIAVDLLQEFASHQLVFEKHTLARVLCDSLTSCATRGHMVNYKGKIMMMETYCNIVGCEQKVMKVNSPKYQRGLKVASRTPNMHFTAFAARYGTNAEEAVLAAAVRVGL